MAATTPKFRTVKRSGFAKQVLILDESKADSEQVVVGAGSNFSWTETYTESGVDQYNQLYVDEIIYNRMELGTGTLAAFETVDLNDKLPTAKNPVVGPYLLLDQIAEGRPDAGKVMNAFKNAFISSVSGGFGGAPGPIAENINVTYSIRLNRKEYLKEYGEEAEAA